MLDCKVNVTQVSLNTLGVSSLEPEDDRGGGGRLLRGEEPEEEVRVAHLLVDGQEAGVALHRPARRGRETELRVRHLLGLLDLPSGDERGQEESGTWDFRWVTFRVMTWESKNLTIDDVAL